MTLIVASVFNGSVTILGDTALTTYNNRFANPIVEGCLKLYKVNDYLAVAFAGSQSHFEMVCRQILHSTSAPEIASIVATAQLNGKDFELLAVGVSDTEIHFIKNGVVSLTAAGFLGDWQAFDAYQTYKFNQVSQAADVPDGTAFFEMTRLPEPISDLSNENYKAMFDAMKKVISDSRFPTVNGIVVPLCTDKGKFTFMNYASVVTGILRLEDFSSTPKRIEFGNAMQGAFAMEFTDDASSGGDGKNIGIYLLQGGFGIIFPDSKTGLRRAQLVTASQPAYWELNTAKILGHAIGSSYLTEDHCGMAGEELISKNRFDDAVFCYELRKDLTNLRERPKVCDRYIAGYATAMFNAGKQNDAISILKDEVNAFPDSSLCIDKLNQMTEIVQMHTKSAL